MSLSFCSIFYRSYHNCQTIRSHLVLILSERSRVLQVASEYINYQLNPWKHNIFDNTREDYEKVKSIEEIFDLLHISVDEYCYYLEISEDDDFQIHLCRPPNSCFANNYFKIDLSAWQANMGIQPYTVSLRNHPLMQWSKPWK